MKVSRFFMASLLVLMSLGCKKRDEKDKEIARVVDDKLQAKKMLTVVSIYY